MAAGIAESPFFQERAAQGALILHDAPKFSLESYINEYAGRTRLDRLAIIGSTSTYLAPEALSLAILEAKRLGDVDAYLSVSETLKKLNLPENALSKLPKDVQAAPDMAWAERRTKETKHETDRLEAELRTYKNNLIKESIRMGNEELGKHYYNIGDYVNAFKSYARMRDYCTTQKHLADMTLRLVFVAVAQKQWGTVASYCQKLHSVTLQPLDRDRLDPIDEACSALQSMQTGFYDQAANVFLRMSPEYITSEPLANILFQREVMTGNDIAVYGGLCALASFDRDTLERRVLANNSFRQFLELEPHIRRAVSAFTQSKYTTCLQILDGYRTDYLLDLHLQRHFEELYRRIRSKAIVQYFIPFSRVTLKEMGQVFPPQEGELIEDELVLMIQRGTLDARIDLVDELLVAPQAVPRANVQADALSMAKSYEKALRLRLLRTNMTNAGLEIKAPKNARSTIDVHSLIDDYPSGGTGRGGRKSHRMG